MPTTIHYGGGIGPNGEARGGAQSIAIERPRDLKGRGYPVPPRQPIANWATERTHFEHLCNTSQFQAAIEYLGAEYCCAGISDVPSGARAAFKAWFQANMKAKPECLTGPTGDWRTDGAGA